MDAVGTGDEVERSVIRFNHCVVLYHLHQYCAALALLEKMYTGLESLGKCPCLLVNNLRDISRILSLSFG